MAYCLVHYESVEIEVVSLMIDTSFWAYSFGTFSFQQADFCFFSAGCLLFLELEGFADFERILVLMCFLCDNLP